MQACRVVRYGDLGLVGSLRVACSRPVRIQLVAVGLDILRNAQASSSVRLCDSIVTPIKENLDCARFVSCALLGI